MLAIGWMVGLGALGLAPADGPAIDSVTLKDGSVVLGQLVESRTRSGWPKSMVVRRAWAEANLPARASAWSKAADQSSKSASITRKARLVEWRRDRSRSPVANDRITPWIDREIARLDGKDGDQKSVLIGIPLPRAEVRTIGGATNPQRSRKAYRLVRLGWLLGLPNVETMSEAELAEAVEAKGFDPTGTSEVSIESLLPLADEPASLWTLRRACTEAANDPGGRFVRYQGILLPEPEPGEAPPADASLKAAVDGIKNFLGEQAVDPLPAKLAELANQGRTGAVVTRMEMAPDFSAVQVEAALWVRMNAQRWQLVITKSATVRPDDLPAGSGEELAEDPQIKAAFGIVEGLGLGQVPPELKRRSLGMGAATRKALGQAKAELDAEIKRFALPLVDPAPPAGPKPKP